MPDIAYRLAAGGPLAAPGRNEVPPYAPKALDWPTVSARHDAPDPWADTHSISHPFETATAYVLNRILAVGKEQPAPRPIPAAQPPPTASGPGPPATFTFPFIRTPAAKAALTGALIGSPDGLAQLQSYFDEAIGDDAEIRLRAEYLIRNLQDASPAADLDMIVSAGNRIADAAAKAAATGYVVPVTELDGFALPKEDKGWDLGARPKNAYLGFKRVGADSEWLVGPMRRLASLRLGHTVFADGIENLDGFVSSLPQGDYRIYIMAREPEARLLDAKPFGDKYTANGVEQRIVAVTAEGPRYIGRLTQHGILRETRNPGPDPLADIKVAGPPRGVMLVGRAHVEGTTLRLGFHGPRGPAKPDTLAEDYEGHIIFGAVTAGYHNTLGSYKVDREGHIRDVRIHFADASQKGRGGALVPGRSASPRPVPPRRWC